MKQDGGRTKVRRDGEAHRSHLQPLSGHMIHATMQGLRTIAAQANASSGPRSVDGWRKVPGSSDLAVLLLYSRSASTIRASAGKKKFSAMARRCMSEPASGGGGSGIAVVVMTDGPVEPLTRDNPHQPVNVVVVVVVGVAVVAVGVGGSPALVTRHGADSGAIVSRAR